MTDKQQKTLLTIIRIVPIVLLSVILITGLILYYQSTIKIKVKDPAGQEMIKRVWLMVPITPSQ